MNGWIALLLMILCVCCATLGLLLSRQKKSLTQLLVDIQAVKNGEKRKVTIHSSGMDGQIGLELNQVVQRHQEEMERKSREEEENMDMLRTLSPDIRTPLQTLLDYLDIVEVGKGGHAERKEYVTGAKRKAYEVRDAVETLFDWFKLDREQTEQGAVPIDLCELTKEVVMEWAAVLEQKEVSAKLELSEQACVAKVNPTAVRRMITNLIQNALEQNRCHQLQMAVKQTEAGMTVAIKDDGIGISGGKLPFVFLRQYDEERVSSRPNSGLGLCMVKELCEKQGGTIEVESTEGESTEFVMTFPPCTEER